MRFVMYEVMLSAIFYAADHGMRTQELLEALTVEAELKAAQAPGKAPLNRTLSVPEIDEGENDIDAVIADGLGSAEPVPAEENADADADADADTNVDATTASEDLSDEEGDAYGML